jgi:hypothetical protein
MNPIEDFQPLKGLFGDLSEIGANLKIARVSLPRGIFLFSPCRVKIIVPLGLA